jgi:hypothetical protein
MRLYPPLTRWASYFRPSGLGDGHPDRKVHFSFWPSFIRRQKGGCPYRLCREGLGRLPSGQKSATQFLATFTLEANRRVPLAFVPGGKAGTLSVCAGRKTEAHCHFRLPGGTSAFASGIRESAAPPGLTSAPPCRRPPLRHPQLCRKACSSKITPTPARPA